MDGPGPPRPDEGQGLTPSALKSSPGVPLIRSRAAVSVTDSVPPQSRHSDFEPSQPALSFLRNPLTACPFLLDALPSFSIIHSLFSQAICKAFRRPVWTNVKIKEKGRIVAIGQGDPFADRVPSARTKHASYLKVCLSLFYIYVRGK